MLCGREKKGHGNPKFSIHTRKGGQLQKVWSKQHDPRITTDRNTSWFGWSTQPCNLLLILFGFALTGTSASDFQFRLYESRTCSGISFYKSRESHSGLWVFLAMMYENFPQLWLLLLRNRSTMSLTIPSECFSEWLTRASMFHNFTLLQSQLNWLLIHERRYRLPEELRIILSGLRFSIPFTIVFCVVDWLELFALMHICDAALDFFWTGQKTCFPNIPRNLNTELNQTVL